jgi:hypothetical protein
MSNVITDPNAVVDGETLTQWVENWYRWADPSPGPILPTPNNYDAFYDPIGVFAAALNFGSRPMYFITQQFGPNPSPDRTFYVPDGESVLVPISGVTDSEGPNITPTLDGFTGTYAQEVNTVLNAYSFTNGSYTLDGGPPKSLSVMDTGIFDAGFAPKQSAGAAFFGVTSPPTELSTTGDKGYWLALDDLSPGTHTIHATGDVTSSGSTTPFSVTDTIVVEPGFRAA